MGSVSNDVKQNNNTRTTIDTKDKICSIKETKGEYKSLVHSKDKICSIKDKKGEYKSFVESKEKQMNEGETENKKSSAKKDFLKIIRPRTFINESENDSSTIDKESLKKEEKYRKDNQNNITIDHCLDIKTKKNEKIRNQENKKHQDYKEYKNLTTDNERSLETENHEEIFLQESNKVEFENERNENENVSRYLEDLYTDNENNRNILLSTIENFIKDENIQEEYTFNKKVSFAKEEDNDHKSFEEKNDRSDHNTNAANFIEAITGGFFSKNSMKNILSHKRNENELENKNDSTKPSENFESFKLENSLTNVFKGKSKKKSEDFKEDFDKFFDKSNKVTKAIIENLDSNLPEENQAKKDKNDVNNDINSQSEKFDQIIEKKCDKSFSEYAKPEDIKFSPIPKRDLFTGKEMTSTPTINKTINELERNGDKNNENEKYYSKKEQCFEAAVACEHEKKVDNKIYQQFKEIKLENKCYQVMPDELQLDQLLKSNSIFSSDMKTVDLFKDNFEIKNDDESKRQNQKNIIKHDFLINKKQKKDAVKIVLDQKQKLNETKAWIHNSLMGTLGVCLLLYLQSMETLTQTM